MSRWSGQARQGFDRHGLVPTVWINSGWRTRKENSACHLLLRLNAAGEFSDFGFDLGVVAFEFGAVTLNERIYLGKGGIHLLEAVLIVARLAADFWYLTLH